MGAIFRMTTLWLRNIRIRSARWARSVPGRTRSPGAATASTTRTDPPGTSLRARARARERARKLTSPTLRTRNTSASGRRPTLRTRQSLPRPMSRTYLLLTFPTLARLRPLRGAASTRARTFWSPTGRISVCPSLFRVVRRFPCERRLAGSNSLWFVQGIVPFRPLGACSPRTLGGTSSPCASFPASGSGSRGCPISTAPLRRSYPVRHYTSAPKASGR